MTKLVENIVSDLVVNIRIVEIYIDFTLLTAPIKVKEIVHFR